MKRSGFKYCPIIINAEWPRGEHCVFNGKKWGDEGVRKGEKLLHKKNTRGSLMFINFFQSFRKI